MLRLPASFRCRWWCSDHMFFFWFDLLHTVVLSCYEAKCYFFRSVVLSYAEVTCMISWPSVMFRSHALFFVWLLQHGCVILFQGKLSFFPFCSPLHGCVIIFLGYPHAFVAIGDVRVARSFFGSVFATQLCFHVLTWNVNFSTLFSQTQSCYHMLRLPICFHWHWWCLGHSSFFGLVFLTWLCYHVLRWNVISSSSFSHARSCYHMLRLATCFHGCRWRSGHTPFFQFDFFDMFV